MKLFHENKINCGNLKMKNGKTVDIKDLKESREKEMQNNA